MNNKKVGLVDRKTKRCFGEEVRKNTGTCMIVFAIPLLIPGTTMTAVAFVDETGFSRYSAVHILGMILLAFAILIFIGGVWLSVRCRSKVGPDEFQQVISTHEKTRKDVNIDSVDPGKPSGHLHKEDVSAVLKPSILSLNYLTENDNIKATPDRLVNLTQDFHTLYQPGLKENLSSAKSLVSDSSSYESSDSDDCSSGSYTIPRESILEFGLESKRIDALKGHQSSSYFKSRKVEENQTGSGFKILKTTVVQPSGVTSNNFFQCTDDDTEEELSERPVRKITSHLQSTATSSAHHQNKKSENILNQKETEVCLTSQVTRRTVEVDHQDKSPGTRHRLHGFRSDSVAISSQTPDSSDPIVVPTQSPITEHAASSRNNFAASYVSVFSITKEPKITSNKMPDIITKNSNSSESLHLDHHRSLARSPYANRPYSFPSGDRDEKSGTAGARLSKQSSSPTQSVRPRSTEGYCSSDKTVVSMTPFSTP